MWKGKNKYCDFIDPDCGRYCQVILKMRQLYHINTLNSKLINFKFESS